jgi:hypothetical protein
MNWPKTQKFFTFLARSASRVDSKTSEQAQYLIQH